VEDLAHGSGLGALVLHLSVDDFAAFGIVDRLEASLRAGWYLATRDQKEECGKA
jgi:hypothetical protein